MHYGIHVAVHVNWDRYFPVQNQNCHVQLCMFRVHIYVPQPQQMTSVRFTMTTTDSPARPVPDKQLVEQLTLLELEATLTQAIKVSRLVGDRNGREDRNVMINGPVVKICVNSYLRRKTSYLLFILT